MSPFINLDNTYSFLSASEAKTNVSDQSRLRIGNDDYAWDEGEQLHQYRLHQEPRCQSHTEARDTNGGSGEIADEHGARHLVGRGVRLRLCSQRWSDIGFEIRSVGTSAGGGQGLKDV